MSPGSPSIQDIQALVCVRFGVTVEQLRGERTDRAISQPRQAAMWLARRASHSTGKIARAFGHRDPTTVGYAVRHVDQLIGEHPIEWGALMTVLAIEAGGHGTPLNGAMTVLAERVDKFGDV